LLTYTQITVSHSAEKQHFSRNAVNLSAILTKHESNVTTAQCVPRHSGIERPEVAIYAGNSRLSGVMVGRRSWITESHG
jgi:hypothetical protein